VSSDLAKKLRLGHEELATVREQLTPLISLPAASAGAIERAAACAMLHSFHTEIEELLKLIAREWDGVTPPSEAWHRQLLNQMVVSTATRPAVLSPPLVEVLGEFLAFQHLFRGASIVLMRWEKLMPLLARVDHTYKRTEAKIGTFVRFIEAGGRTVETPSRYGRAWLRHRGDSPTSSNPR
jgi:hypothetical protein